MYKHLITGIRGILEIVYPPLCLSCGRISQEIICDVCENSLVLFKAPLCDKCGKPTAQSVPACRECSSKKYYISKLRALGLYDGNLKQLVKLLKYSNSFKIARYFATKIIGSYHEELLSDKSAVVTFVPSRRSRQAARGYNQSELIARAVSESTLLPLVETLAKVKRTKEQSGLSKAERIKNMENAFRCAANKKIYSQKVILIDDVFTSGTTMNEAAKVLTKSGAREVLGIVAARTLDKQNFY